MDWVIGIGLILFLAGAYPASCWLWPFTNCGWCKGTGRKGRKDGKVWRPCRHCGGLGKRLRFGRWLFNHYVKVRRNAS
jgi:hypothetical protein